MKWHGSTVCDLCGANLCGKVLFDGKMIGGPWAVMCRMCHLAYGVGLGRGRGQEYAPTSEGHEKAA